MAIIYQKDQGLINGLNQAGSILGQVLMQKAQERTQLNQFKNINKSIEGKPFNSTLLQTILEQPGGLQYLQQIGPLIQSSLKAQAEQQGANDYFQNAIRNSIGSNNYNLDQAPTVSPIMEAKMIQNKRDLGPNIRVNANEEALSAESNVPSISGVPSRPPVEDSNRVGPKEQTNFQQGGQSGMGLEPPQEGGEYAKNLVGAMARAEPNTVPANSPAAQGLDLNTLSPEQREKIALALAGSPYPQHKEQAKILQDQAKVERENRNKFEDRSFQINKPLYEQINNVRNSLPEKEIALARIEDAIQSGDINRFIDFAADRLGLDPLKSTPAQILESAVKTFFLSDLQSLQGGRLNQLIEGNLLKAFQNVGKSPAANQEVTETLYALQDIAKERVKAFDEIADKYDKAGRELPRNTQKLIDDKLNPFIKEKLSELNKTRKELKEGKVRSNSAVQMRRAKRITNDNPAPEGTRWVLAPNGSVKAIPLNQIKAAQDAGGRLINE